MIKKLPKVIQFQAVEPGFEPKPLGFEVRSVNCDTIQSYNDEVQKADLGKKARWIEGGDNMMRLDFKQNKSGVI